MDSMITIEQWKILETCVELSAKKEEEDGDVIYKMEVPAVGKVRHLIYDNYDRYTSPGLNFVIGEGEERGKLVVYSGSEESYAPIDFKTGLEIAENFFGYVGTELSEEVVCDYLSEGHGHYDLWS